MLNYKKILVPVDFTQISKSAIIKAASHSEASNSELLITHILDDSTPHSDDSAQRVSRAEQKLDALLDDLEIGYCEKLVMEGETLATLMDLIRERQIDLVVMGTHNGTSLSPLMRSISVEVVTHTECDVLVLHQ